MLENSEAKPRPTPGEVRLPPVCILTAGMGTRMGKYSHVINKALLPIRGQACISQIIEKFSDRPRTFVIALGFKGDQVRDYLLMAHPELDFQFVNISPIEGPGSGPGYSLWSCRQYLREPFYFVSCDTLWQESVAKMPSDKSWLGVAVVPENETQNYCSLKIENHEIIEVIEKSKVDSKNVFAFTGLAFFKDHEQFWNDLRQNSGNNEEIQVSQGFKGLVLQGKISAIPIDWIDLGTAEKYLEQRKKEENFDFSKQDEFLYQFNKRVIKFFSDETIALNRVKKTQLNPSVFPEIDRAKGNFFSYLYQPGTTLYQNSSVDLFRSLIPWLQENLWIRKTVNDAKLEDLCDRFYRLKSIERLNKFKQKYLDATSVKVIQKQEIPSAEELMRELPWSDLRHGTPCFIHGDLQPDNIIFDSNTNRFLLLDWRQDFSGEIEFGDLYYDLAKLWGGLNLNYDEIKKGNFKYHEEDGICSFQFPSHPHSEFVKEILEDFLVKEGFSLSKVKCMVGLIYLNMAPLHHYPFDKMLAALGRLTVFENRY